MKKIAIILICFCVSFCLCGCSNDKNVIILDEYNYLDYIDTDAYETYRNSIAVEFMVKSGYEIVDDIAINYSADWVFKTDDPYNSGFFGVNGTIHDSGTVEGRIKITKDSEEKNGIEKHNIGLSSSLGESLDIEKVDVKHVEGKIKPIEKD